MDLEEARDISKMGWPENQKAQRQHDAVDWLCAEVDRLLENVAHQSAVNTDLRAELSRLTLSAAESRREVERLAAMVIYDCREAGVCPDLADAIDALGLMTEQQDGADALIKAERTRAEKAEADRDKYKAALEKIGRHMRMYEGARGSSMADVYHVAREALAEAVRTC